MLTAVDKAFTVKVLRQSGVFRPGSEFRRIALAFGAALALPNYY
jgi:hypothetical protein